MCIPLTSDPEFSNSYSTANGTVRIGKLLEDLDLFALGDATNGQT